MLNQPGLHEGLANLARSKGVGAVLGKMPAVIGRHHIIRTFLSRVLGGKTLPGWCRMCALPRCRATSSLCLSAINFCSAACSV